MHGLTDSSAVSFLTCHVLCAVDSLPPVAGAPTSSAHREVHRLQSNVKRLMRYIVRHPLGRVGDTDLVDCLQDFIDAEKAYEQSAQARRDASSALLACFEVPSCLESDGYLNDIIASFTAH